MTELKYKLFFLPDLCKWVEIISSVHDTLCQGQLARRVYSSPAKPA